MVEVSNIVEIYIYRVSLCIDYIFFFYWKKVKVRFVVHKNRLVIGFMHDIVHGDAKIIIKVSLVNIELCYSISIL